MKKLCTLFALTILAAALTGCGSDVDDPSRTPAGAPDTSDPSAVNMGTTAPQTPPSATPGPSGN